MAEGFIERPFDLSHKFFSQVTAVTSRVTLSAGGFVKQGNIVIFNQKITANATATNSPQILSGLPEPRIEVPLDCIDITSGIATAITGSVPCGVATNGAVYQKEITTGHIYVISGVYISDS